MNGASSLAAGATRSDMGGAWYRAASAGAYPRELTCACEAGATGGANRKTVSTAVENRRDMA